MSFGVSGKYRLDRRLGGGGMAEVFVGSTVGAEGFSRRVAIKRVLPGYSDNPGFAQMFVAEAQISSQLVHPNIVSVVDFDRDAEGRLFLVMELVDGKDLDALVSTGLLPFPVVIFVIGEVLRGLGFAHDLPTGSGMRGIVHRDISPHNILLSWEGAVKVSDFGIAKARAASEATASVFIKGKPAYMSPEQANGQRLDGRSDLFAVGVMLWEMLVGQRLFVAEDTRATLAAVLFGQIPRPRTLRPDIPKDLERVAMKLLERDLPMRYATGEEAIADLVNCADAPRDGREALMAVLAQRFPDTAPVRQSISRARSLAAPPTPVPGAMAVSPPRETLTGTGGGSYPMAPTQPPGLGTFMQAATGTLDVPRPRRWVIPVLAAIAAVVVGVAAFVVVSTMKRERKVLTVDAGSGSAVVTINAGSAAPPPPPPAGSAAPANTGSAVSANAGSAAPATTNAGSAVPTTANAGSTAPANAGSGAPPQKAAPDAAISPPPMKTESARMGYLEVVAMPVLTVTVDGRVYGDTPRKIKLKVGKHRVQLDNAGKNIHETLSVMIKENQTTPLERM